MKTLFVKENKYYIMHVKEYNYCINSPNFMYEYNPMVLINVLNYNLNIINNEYLTIAESKDGIKYKDVIHFGKKYQKGFNVGLSKFYEVECVKIINNLNKNMTKKEWLEYLKKYVSEVKEESLQKTKQLRRK